MLYKTHLEIGENALRVINGRGKKILNHKSFLKGNVLPDISPKYRLKKHGRKQFETIIKHKVLYLTSLSTEEIINKIGKEKFSVELGIICHFLCDFFSLPHDKEWGVKESITLKHVMYEKKMHKTLSEKKILMKESYKILGNTDYKSFLQKSLCEYRKKYGHDNDLFFAMYLTNSVMRYIFDCIEFNDKKKLLDKGYVVF